MEKNKILIADDSEMNREMISEILGDKYDFAYAENGVEVINTLRGKSDIDLILLDINMPKMDGFEVLRIMNERHLMEEYPVIIISASGGNDFINQAYKLGAVDYIQRPYNALVVQRRVENTLLMYSNQKRLQQLVINQVYDKENNNNSMISLLGNIVESRNQELGSHTLNVQMGTELLLKEVAKMSVKYTLSKSDIAMISSLAALHDIGKIRVPESILNKPGKLTPEEWAIMQSHTVEGYNILKAALPDQESKFVKVACEICRWHHEKYDGKGYPDGLVGDEIPISAQVVSLADVYDALTSERCYKKAFSHDTAIQMILNGECGSFNPLLLECLKNISTNLKNIKESGKPYDFQSVATYVAEELLTSKALPTSNSMRRMMDNERKKKEFFMGCAEGIQFEYDKVLHKACFVYKNEDDTCNPLEKTVFRSKDSEDNILPVNYWEDVSENLHKNGRENPRTCLDVKLFLNGEYVPYRAKVMAIWPEDGADYIYVLGHFTKI